MWTYTATDVHSYAAQRKHCPQVDLCHCQVLRSMRVVFTPYQRRRDDNKNRIFAFEGGVLGAERKIVQKRLFRGKRHDNKILKVQILLSRNFVVIAQAPTLEGAGSLRSPP